LDDYKRKQIVSNSPLFYKYDNEIDRESAYEMLLQRNNREIEQMKLEKERLELEKLRAKTTKKSNRITPVERVTNSAMSAIGREIGRSLIRGVLGSLRR